MKLTKHEQQRKKNESNTRVQCTARRDEINKTHKHTYIREKNRLSLFETISSSRFSALFLCISIWFRFIAYTIFILRVNNLYVHFYQTLEMWRAEKKKHNTRRNANVYLFAHFFVCFYISWLVVCLLSILFFSTTEWIKSSRIGNTCN